MAKKIKPGKYYEHYEDVLKYITSKNDKLKLHLLLGNGFSIAFNSELFSYKALKRKVCNNDSELNQLFAIAGTTNFEEIMRQLDFVIKITQEFGKCPAYVTKVELLKKKLQESLVLGIKELHPECVFNLSQEQINSCAHFIEPFTGDDNSIISTNYDLLLYWVLMRYEVNGKKLNINDGFSHVFKKGLGGDVFIRDNSTLVWGMHTDKQNVFYLHGALHLFDQLGQIIKEQYDEQLQEFIMEKISSRIEKGIFPIFVTEGDGNQKLNQIRHNGYLSDCYSHLQQITGRLVTYGLSFSENDMHIVNALNEASTNPNDCLRSVYIGVFNENDKDHIQKLVQRGIFNFKVNTFDASSINPWIQNT